MHLHVFPHVHIFTRLDILNGTYLCLTGIESALTERMTVIANISQAVLNYVE